MKKVQKAQRTVQKRKLIKLFLTSLLSKSAAKDPSTILGDIGELGPIFARRREVPKLSFFSLISRKC